MWEINFNFGKFSNCVETWFHNLIDLDVKCQEAVDHNTQILCRINEPYTCVINHDTTDYDLIFYRRRSNYQYLGFALVKTEKMFIHPCWYRGQTISNIISKCWALKFWNKMFHKLMIISKTYNFELRSNHSTIYRSDVDVEQPWSKDWSLCNSKQQFCYLRKSLTNFNLLFPIC